MEFKVQENLIDNEISYLENKIAKVNFENTVIVDGMEEVDIEMLKSFYQEKEHYKVIAFYYMVTNGNEFKVKYHKDSFIDTARADVVIVEIPYYKQKDFKKVWKKILRKFLKESLKK